MDDKPVYGPSPLSLAWRHFNRSEEFRRQVLDRYFPVGLPEHFFRGDPPMTESEWLSSDDPESMLSHLKHGGLSVVDPADGLRGALPGDWKARVPSDRKLRLFAVACYRIVQPSATDADACEHKRPPHDPAVVRVDSDYAWAMRWAKKGFVPPYQDTKAALLRDIVGNPWRPWIREPPTLNEIEAKPNAQLLWHKWARPGSVAWNIAQAIYEERAFDRLPILADALEEAGCVDAAILNHCRGRSLRIDERVAFIHPRAPSWVEYTNRWVDDHAPHCRGCWVLDLILGKN